MNLLIKTKERIYSFQPVVPCRRPGWALRWPTSRGRTRQGSRRRSSLIVSTRIAKSQCFLNMAFYLRHRSNNHSSPHYSRPSHNSCTSRHRCWIRVDVHGRDGDGLHLHAQHDRHARWHGIHDGHGVHDERQRTCDPLCEEVSCLIRSCSKAENCRVESGQLRVRPVPVVKDRCGRRHSPSKAFLWQQSYTDTPAHLSQDNWCDPHFCP